MLVPLKFPTSSQKVEFHIHQSHMEIGPSEVTKYIHTYKHTYKAQVLDIEKHLQKQVQSNLKVFVNRSESSVSYLIRVSGN